MTILFIFQSGRANRCEQKYLQNYSLIKLARNFETNFHDLRLLIKLYQSTSYTIGIFLNEI